MLAPASRPAGLASAAACVLAGADPLLVSGIDANHPALAPAVRELAAMLGEPVPARYALLLPPGRVVEMFDDSIDPREAYPSAAEAEEEYAWACSRGLIWDPENDCY